MAGETLSLFGGILLVDLIACSPALLFTSVRELFDLLPAGRLSVNYLTGVTGFAVLQLGLLATTLILLGRLSGTAVIWGLGLTAAGTGILVWLVAALLLPRLGWWDPTASDGLDGRIGLGIALVTYIGGTGIALMLLMVIAIALFFPG